MSTATVRRGSTRRRRIWRGRAARKLAVAANRRGEKQRSTARTARRAAPAPRRLGSEIAMAVTKSVSLPPPDPLRDAHPNSSRHLRLRVVAGPCGDHLQAALPARPDRRRARVRDDDPEHLARSRTLLRPPRSRSRLSHLGPGSQWADPRHPRRRQDHALWQAVHLPAGGGALLRRLRGPGTGDLQHGAVPGDAVGGMVVLAQGERPRRPLPRRLLLRLGRFLLRLLAAAGSVRHGLRVLPAAHLAGGAAAAVLELARAGAARRRRAGAGRRLRLQGADGSAGGADRDRPALAAPLPRRAGPGGAGAGRPGAAARGA